MASEPGVPGIEVVRYLFAYHAWAGERLFAAVERCDVNRWPKAIAGGHGDGSLFATLAHMVGAEQRWYQRWHGVPLAELRDDGHYGTVVEVAGEWREVQRKRRDWLASMTGESLSGDVCYVASRGAEERNPLWQTLLHVANHTTHHRAEACVALTSHGAPPQSVDLIDFIRAGSPGAGAM